MDPFAETADAFVSMAHTIVWCTVATVDRSGRPRTRILHPIWEATDDGLVGWIATRPTALKRAHIAAHPHVSCSYWAPSHDTCLAECDASWANDDETRARVWDLFLHGPEPVGYDPTIVPGWTGPLVDAFGVLRLVPWRLRVFPGTLLLGQGGTLRSWARD